jgi:hypothetical protein
MSRAAVTAAAALLAFGTMPTSGLAEMMFRTVPPNAPNPSPSGPHPETYDAVFVNNTSVPIKRIDHRFMDGTLHPLVENVAPKQEHHWEVRWGFCKYRLRIEFENGETLEGETDTCAGPVEVYEG